MSEKSAGKPLAPGSVFDPLPPLPADAAVTMAYVPFQDNTERFSDERALCEGTLFKSLYKPFLRGAIRE